MLLLRLDENGTVARGFGFPLNKERTHFPKPIFKQYWWRPEEN